MEESLSIPEDDEIKEYCKAWLEQQILTNFEFVWHAPNKGIVDSNLIPVLKSMPGKPILEEGVRFLHNGKIKVYISRTFFIFFDLISFIFSFLLFDC